MAHLSLLPFRDGSKPEAAVLMQTYFQLLNKADIEESEFVEACDRIMFTDVWFPVVARIIAVARQCRRERMEREREAERAQYLRDVEHRTERPADVTWPQQLTALRDPLTGRIDMNALYRLSRELRGLDPNDDDRPSSSGSWRTIGDVARDLVEAADD
jgi:hypothetical protein